MVIQRRCNFSFAGLYSWLVYVFDILVKKFSCSFQEFGSRRRSYLGILVRNKPDSTRAPCFLLLFNKDPPVVFDHL